MEKTTEKLMTIPEVAERLRCSESFVYARMADGSLKHYALGTGRGAKRVSESQLLEFMKDRERGSEPAPPLRDIHYRGS